jgi:hypothetical protein
MPTDVDQPKSTLQARLTLEAARLKQTAAALPAGEKRDAVLNKARQYDNALYINEWLGAPGLQPAR